MAVNARTKMQRSRSGFGGEGSYSILNSRRRPATSTGYEGVPEADVDEWDGVLFDGTGPGE